MKNRARQMTVAEMLREDPEYAADLLNSILEEGDQAEMLIALRQIAEAFGGVQAVARAAGLNPNQLYRTLSAEGNPTINSLSAILQVMGLRLAVQPLIK